ncbi:hypothetical protein BDY24DRAFT_390333 [Mrakia frigida]|uniref:uncharacterized protein n=1 Tax=Mrakia frigida TaxID=29902 RepID=UPI003FCC06D4
MSSPSPPPRVPLEIIDKIIEHSWDSPSTLAAWCSVSQRFLDVVSPLLHRRVVLKRPQDLMSFLPLLMLSSSSTKSLRGLSL